MARMIPMMEDKEDKRVFRDMEIPSNAMSGSTVPMFHTTNRAQANVEGRYKNGICFLVSNGPSLLSLDLELLKTPGVMTMAVNNGPATLLSKGITPSFWTCVDQPCRFIKQIWLNPAVLKFVPTASFDKPLWDNETWKAMDGRVADYPNVLGYMRNEKFAAHRFFTESSINWGCHKTHGGCRSVLLPAIRIPYLLGFRTLFLLGVDLEMAPNKGYHFDEAVSKGAINGNMNTYNRLITEYGPGIRQYADALGYKIYNCNPNSRLTAFEYKSFTDAIQMVKTAYGPTDTIQTRGMYLTWEEKQGLTREQAIAKREGTA